MIEKMSLKEFEDSGILLYINQIIQPFGLSLAMDIYNGEPESLYPIKTKYRGFNEDSVQKAYLKLNRYIKDNIEFILSVDNN